MSELKMSEPKYVEDLRQQNNDLRAEVERLTGELDEAAEDLNLAADRILEMKSALLGARRERDEALEGQDLLQRAFDETHKQVAKERDEALAQVAVPVQAIQAFERAWIQRPEPQVLALAVLDLTSIVENLPTEARTLLDRFKRAEAVTEAAQAICRMEWTLDGDCSLVKQTYLQKLTGVLAAWEEGRA